MLTTTVFGHRGYPTRFPENSLAGFRYALDQGIEGLEFDVHLTADQVPVIMHDERIDRTTDGSGRIDSYTFSQLRRFRLANGEPVPSLAELLKLVTDRDVQLNLELKTDKIQHPGIEAIVMCMVHATSLRRPVIFSSFHLPTLKNCQVIAPNESYCWLTDKPVAQPADLVAREHLSGLHLSHFQSGVPVAERIWTVDNPTIAADLMRRHVAGIFTDDFVTMMQVKRQIAN
ncbi:MULTISPECIES: glycerophosphodiester phosphodiesterase family protein [Lactobacillaceae]|uniref:glycerophosphodiester phosphodiesterase n=1 Tax=Lactobacillaceae TaxID=33958 RepID=UPI0014571256|nr:glycerophosphodiester phosphodiesterase family protein [Lactobacillus sp. HBUAS51381]NLR10380.1 glycerophosphodiester phosphodiesterase [Lactobacillus sp. HBUAS51381]